MKTNSGNPRIKEFGAYNGAGQVFNDADGIAARHRAGK